MAGMASMAGVCNLSIHHAAAPLPLRPLRRNAGRRTTVAAARPRNSKGDNSAVPERKVEVPSEVPAGVEQVLQPMTPMTPRHRCTRRPQFWVERHASDTAKGLSELNAVNPLIYHCHAAYMPQAGTFPQNRAGSGAHTATPTSAQSA